MSIFEKIKKLFNPDNKTKKDISHHPISTNLRNNVSYITNQFQDSPDVIINDFLLFGKYEAVVVFIDGLVNEQTISEGILEPLIHYKNTSSSINDIHSLVTVSKTKPANLLSEVVTGVLGGDTALLIDQHKEGWLFSTKGWAARGIEQPDSEVVVRGPREGFTETIRTNTALIRRKIRSPKLTLESFVMGEQTRTDVAIVYLRGVVNNRLVNEVKHRLKGIETDSILESGYIEEFIEDAPFSLFATVGYTERPDVAAAKILEGKVAILVDGSPMVLTVPKLFIESFQSPEDYYVRPLYATTRRLIRYIAFAFSILGPALYVALATFHQEFIPTTLLVTIAAATEGTPLPPVLAALAMGFIFEVLFEAGVRLPRPVGQAVSIVGALVIGDAAISAGFVSAPIVMVVALTAISSFLVPFQTEVGPTLRLLFTLLAATLGAFGIGIGLLVLLIHLSSLRSFGMPYLAPFAPTVISDQKDAIIRVHWWQMLGRPRLVSNSKKRQQSGAKPTAPERGE